MSFGLHCPTYPTSNPQPHTTLNSSSHSTATYLLPWTLPFLHLSIHIPICPTWHPLTYSSIYPSTHPIDIYTRIPRHWSNARLCGQNQQGRIKHSRNLSSKNSQTSRKGKTKLPRGTNERDNGLKVPRRTEIGTGDFVSHGVLF